MLRDFHISSAHHRVGLHGNLPFWVSILKESQKLIPPNQKLNVLDFGCAEGKFLQIIDLFFNISCCVGVDYDKDLIEVAQINNQNQFIEYITDDQLSSTLITKKEFFDVVYSQEVLYTLEDLNHHAQVIYSVLKNRGFYFATIGCHTDNPFWIKRREIIKQGEKYPVYDYSLHEVTEIFHKAGFEVCLKRLPMEYFAVYHPNIVKEFGSLSHLVTHCIDYKMLFCFYKK